MACAVAGRALLATPPESRVATQMSSLADGTGGSFFHNSNDLGAGFKGLTAVPEYVYLLELPIDGMQADGTYHHLKVNVDRSDVELKARAGYFLAKEGKAKK